ncbi:MAG: DUF302 domain-containing protein [Alphaproteobacteria bacterium]|nr:DUF302 domain-containing protein [Alphaproteobacteria bacterium]
MSHAPYGLHVTLAGATFDDALARTTAALADQGFGVLTTIDVAAVMKKKLDLDLRPYTILGACNPKLASAAIEVEPDVGLLLPCNVLVQAEADGVRVSFADPASMASVSPTDALQPVMAEARGRLQKVADALGG